MIGDTHSDAGDGLCFSNVNIGELIRFDRED